MSDPKPNKECLEVENVTLWGGGAKLLNQLSADFPLHQCTVIMGFSGSGRTTLLKIMAGILWPEEGLVRYKGKALTKMSQKELLFYRSRIGFAFQDAALWSNLTVYQNLYLPLQFHRPKAHPGELEQHILSLSKEYGLEGDLQLRPAQLSAGKRILVSFVRSIVLDPDVLFLDEPTTFLDNLSVDRILRTLKQMKKQGKTLLIATHSPELTSQLADRLVVMKGGSILEAGPVQQVVRSKNPLVIEVISEVLSEAAVYDTDILELLQED